MFNVSCNQKVQKEDRFHMNLNTVCSSVKKKKKKKKKKEE